MKRKLVQTILLPLPAAALRFAGWLAAGLLLAGLQLVGCPPAFAMDDSVQVVTLKEYRQQLAELEQKTKSLDDHPESAAKTGAEIPQEIIVETSSSNVTVNFRPLKNDLASFSSGDATRKAALKPRIQEYVRNLAAEAAQFDHQTTPGDARAKLENIMAGKEFNRVRGPGALQVWLDRVENWIGRLLSRNGSGGWSILQIVLLSLAGVALGALLIWTVRRLSQKAGEDQPREIIPFSPSAKGWRTWLAEARESEKQMDWHNAVHLAYWAGISYLEEHGAWKPNRARTPREYLRLLGAWTPQHPPLAALTRKFEAVWYGHRPAGPADFQETLDELERLGCR